MWRKFADQSRIALGAITGFLRSRHYDEAVLTAIFRWSPYVVASVLTAMLAVLYARMFEWIEHLLHLIKAHVPALFFILTPLCLLAGWRLVQRYAPAAGGSGIPQLMAALNPRRDTAKVPMGSLLGLKILLVKFASSIVALLGGAVIGREGPTIQISGSVFYIVYKLLPSNWPRIERTHMLIAGGAAGLAAAFNTPLGGIVFAIEELAKSHLNAFKSTLLFAVIFSGMTAQWLLGSYLYLGYPKVTAGGFSMLSYVIVFSALAGLAGAYKGRLIFWILVWKRKLKSRFAQVAFVVASGLVIASLIYFNENIAYGPGKEIMNQFLFEGSSAHASVGLLASRFFGAILSYCTGVAGGVFATSLSTGAVVGELLMTFFQVEGDNKLLILVCMIGFLTGLTRSPFTSAILVLEMTDRHSAIFPFMMAGLVASVVARSVDKKSIYERLEGQFLG